jgi:hypothetical protein
MKLVLQIEVTTRGLYALINPGSRSRGFVIKPSWHMMFSERERYWRGLRIGPLYFRTFAKREENRIWSRR